MRYLLVLMLLVAAPATKANITPDTVKDLVEASRLDLQILSFRLNIDETNNRIARGMPTAKLANIFREFAGKLEVQKIYNNAIRELASSLDQEQINSLMQCFTSDFMHQYHLAQYQRLTREGSKAFRDQLVPLDLGITEPDPSRLEKLKPLQTQNRNPEIWRKTTKQMFWLINLDIRAKYPMLARDRESMDAYFDQQEFEEMSGDSARYGLLVSYVMLDKLSDDQLTKLLACQRTPAMVAYDESTTRALRDYLIDAEATWVTSDDRATP